MDNLFRTTVIPCLESLPLGCSDGAFALEENFKNIRMLKYRDYKQYLVL
jgi:hypothetical protein